ncbi:MAG: hypothetical protein GY851_33075 [bacterium]|nr:hypothetical protein [bacterium]
MSETMASGNGTDRWFAYRSFRQQEDTMRDFARIGVDTVCFFPANTDCGLGVPYSAYPPVWVGPDTYDFESLDRQVGDIQQANPGAKLLCLIDLNTPCWWTRLHGGESGHGDTFYDQGRMIASEAWREETKAYEQAFLRHMSATYPGLVAGYILACGSTTEWLDFSRGEESIPRRAAWRKWMLDRGHEDPVDVPPMSVRDRTPHGIFRDPVEDRLAVEYWRFHAWLTGDAIQYFAGAAQEILDHRVKLGTFYGYILEHPLGQLLHKGHLDFDRVFQCPDLDFFVAPGSYYDRQIGGGPGQMLPLGSLRQHGKGFIHEIDHRTHTSTWPSRPGMAQVGDVGRFPDEDAAIAGLRREFCFALCEGASLWWFDMFGHWYEGEHVMDALDQMRVLWERLAPTRRGPAAEVAMVVDAESMLYVEAGAPIISNLMYRQRAGLSRMGAPYEAISFADLDTADLSRYKLMLFPNLFYVDAARRELLVRKVCIDGRTVVWVHGPGVVSADRYDPAHVEQITGIPGDSPELAVREMGGWTSVFAPQPNLSAGSLRDLARRADAHVYCDGLEPLYASHNLLALHSLDGGTRTFTLPRPCACVTELFTNRLVAWDATEFTDTIDAPGTVLYELAWNA